MRTTQRQHIPVADADQIVNKSMLEMSTSNCMKGILQERDACTANTAQLKC